MKEIKDFINESNRYKGNLQKCYELGYDAGLNGATEENCHFGLFASKEMSDSWSEGNKKGKEEKNKNE